MERSELVKVGVVACVACCAPVLVLLVTGGLVAGAVGTIWFGALGLVVACVVIAGILLWRRSRRSPPITTPEDRR